MPLILLSILFNYSIGTGLARSATGIKAKNKRLLIIGITGNIVLLGYYKYAGFIATNLNYLFHLNFVMVNIALPLGISFFTFTQIAYLVDTYKGKVKEYDLLNYSLFVSYFPHLLAGPILHHSYMMPQFARLRNSIVNFRNISLGLFIFSMGFSKKVLIADNFALWANAGFDKADNTAYFFHSWITSLSYSMQIYFDFSGYTDMAIGSALLCNINLPINFNSPYKSLNIQEFWRRWHITLGKFLKDYIYIPLGGNRAGEIIMYSNLLITFLIGGIWHGAGWNFIIWGLLHGFALVVSRIYSNLKIGMNNLLAMIITFLFVNATWVFFRAHELKDAIRILKGMCGLNGISLPASFASRLPSLSQYGFVFEGAESDKLIKLALFIPLVFILKNSNEYVQEFLPNKRYLAFSLALLFASLLNMAMQNTSEFIYFDF